MLNLFPTASVKFIAKLSFGFKFRFHTALDKRKLWLVDYLFSVCNSEVISGHFKGMKLMKKSNWDKKIYEYNPDLCIDAFGERLNDIQNIEEGSLIECDINISSREWKEKW